MRPIFLVFLASLTLAFAAIVPRAAATEIYKWVDEKGVTNYSGAPPASARARRLDPRSAMVSVYTPAPVDAARLADSIQRRRIARLEEEVQAQRRASQVSQVPQEEVAPGGYYYPGAIAMTGRGRLFRPALAAPFVNARFVQQHPHRRHR